MPVETEILSLAALFISTIFYKRQEGTHTEKQKPFLLLLSNIPKYFA